MLQGAEWTFQFPSGSCVNRVTSNRCRAVHPAWRRGFAAWQRFRTGHLGMPRNAKAHQPTQSFRLESNRRLRRSVEAWPSCDWPCAVPRGWYCLSNAEQVQLAFNGVHPRPSCSGVSVHQEPYWEMVHGLQARTRTLAVRKASRRPRKIRKEIDCILSLSAVSVNANHTGLEV